MARGGRDLMHLELEAHHRIRASFNFAIPTESQWTFHRRKTIPIVG
jgi:hypothetical protein